MLARRTRLPWPLRTLGRPPLAAAAPHRRPPTPSLCRHLMLRPHAGPPLHLTAARPSRLKRQQRLVELRQPLEPMTVDPTVGEKALLRRPLCRSKVKSTRDPAGASHTRWCPHLRRSGSFSVTQGPCGRAAEVGADRLEGSGLSFRRRSKGRAATAAGSDMTTRCPAP